MTDQKYIEASQGAGRKFVMRQISGPVIMLNLLKFKEKADYTDLEDIAPDREISGKEAYKIYMKETLPFLEEAGGELIFYGKGGPFLIGPENMEWDLVMLVKHASMEKFLGFANNKAYLKIAGHRKAALEDSRLLPIVEH